MARGVSILAFFKHGQIFEKRTTLLSGSTVVFTIAELFSSFSLVLITFYYTLLLYCAFVFFVENALSIANLQRMIFWIHCYTIAHTFTNISSSSFDFFGTRFFCSSYKNHSSSFCFPIEGGFLVSNLAGSVWPNGILAR